MRPQQVPQLSASYNMPLSTPFQVKPPQATRTKALLIGINYVGHNVGVLSGCHNDVRVMKQFIKSQVCLACFTRCLHLLETRSADRKY